MRPTFELHAFLDEGGKSVPCHLRISEARPSTGGASFYCCVHAPALFSDEKYIFGVDAEQACALAVKFMRNELVGKRLVDASGQPVEVSILQS